MIGKKFELFFGYDESAVKYIDMNNSHYQNLMIVGNAGTGKTTIMHNIIMHMIAKYNREEVEVRILNINWYNEFEKYQDFGIQIKDIQRDAEDSLYKLKAYFDDLLCIMNERFELMNKNGWHEYWQIPDTIKPPRIVVLISNLDAMDRVMNDTFEQHEILYTLHSLVRMGSTVGIHIIAEGQIIYHSLREMLPFFRKAIVLYGSQDTDLDVLLEMVKSSDRNSFRLARRQLKQGEALVYDGDHCLLEKNRFPLFVDK